MPTGLNIMTMLSAEGTDGPEDILGRVVTRTSVRANLNPLLGLLLHSSSQCHPSDCVQKEDKTSRAATEEDPEVLKARQNRPGTQSG